MGAEILSSGQFLDPPQNLEAEQALLSAILANNHAYDQVADFLDPEYFFEETHGSIYAAAGTLINDGRRADAITLKGYFEREQSLETIGGAEYLARLQASFAAGSRLSFVASCMAGGL